LEKKNKIKKKFFKGNKKKMKVTLSLEKTVSKDVSIVVDALRASATITVAFNNFKNVIPAFNPDEARKIAKNENAILAGERKGKKLEGFDIGNSPEKVENYKTNKDTIVITTSNGTRIMEAMNSTVLVGCFVNAKSVAKKALEIATDHIDLVMAGRNSDFALEDYLACGEILYWIKKELKKEDEISEYALGSILASRDYPKIKEIIPQTKSGQVLSKLNHQDDIKYCMQKNITKNVVLYENRKLRLL
jgi:2-phosphosulfolactate phosphatase